MEELSAENVLKAIEAMYGQTPVPNFKEYDNWLKKFQSSPQAWSVVDQIFSIPNLPEIAYIFAAQTLKTKFAFDFEEVKSFDLERLKTNLLELCEKYSDLDKVMRQLAQCVGILAIHLAESWSSLFPDLYSRFQNKTHLLLEVLKCLAEEIEDSSLVVDTDYLRLLRNLLRQNSKHILQYLENLPSEYSVSVLETFVAWVQIGLNTEALMHLPQSKLLNMCFEALRSPPHFQTGVRVVCELIKTAKDLPEFRDTLNMITLNVLKLETEVRQALEAQDSELVEGYSQVYRVVGLNHPSMLGSQESLQILNLLCDLLYSESLAAIKDVTDFWHKFCNNYRRSLLNQEPTQEPTQELNSLFNKLLQTTITQCKLSTSTLQSITKDNELDQETEEKRFYLSETVQDISNVLGDSATFSVLQQNLLQLVYNNSIQVSQEEKLCQIEAIAVCLSGLFEGISTDLTSTVQQSLTCLASSIWPSHQLNLTVCKLLTSASHRILPESLSVVMRFLANALTTPGLHFQACEAFQAICSDNATSLVEHSDSLLQILSASFEMSEDSQEKLLEGISAVVWRVQEDSVILQVTSYYAKPLNELAQQNKVDDDVMAKNSDMLAVILKTAYSYDISKDKVYSIFKQLWPVLTALLNLYKSDTNSVERICRIIKHSMKKIGVRFSEFTNDFTQIIVSQFSQYGHSSYLYMCENLVRVFGVEGEHKEQLSQLFTTLVDSSVARLSSFESIRGNPELTEDLFGMAMRYLNYAPETALLSPAFPNLVEVSKNGIGLYHTEAAKCMYGFLEILTDLADSTNFKYMPQADQVLSFHCNDILARTIKAVVDVMPKVVFDCICDLVSKIIVTKHPQAGLEEALKHVPHDCLTLSEKQKFLMQVDSLSGVCDWLETLNRRARRRALRIRQEN